MKIISACLIVIFLVISFNFGQIFAHSTYEFPEATGGQISEALIRTVPIRFLPTHPFYFLIFLKENFSEFLQPNAIRKASFDFQVSGKRLKETYTLAEAGDLEDAKGNLINYGKAIDTTIDQIEKAKSQNLDVSALASEIADGLKDHEVLLYAIRQKGPESFDSDESFDEAVSEFKRMIMVVDEIRPGLKDRFRI